MDKLEQTIRNSGKYKAILNEQCFKIKENNFSTMELLSNEDKLRKLYSKTINCSKKNKFKEKTIKLVKNTHDELNKVVNDVEKLKKQYTSYIEDEIYVESYECQETLKDDYMKDLKKENLSENFREIMQNYVNMIDERDYHLDKAKIILKEELEVFNKKATKWLYFIEKEKEVNEVYTHSLNYKQENNSSIEK